MGNVLDCITVGYLRIKGGTVLESELATIGEGLPAIIGTKMEASCHDPEAVGWYLYETARGVVVARCVVA